MADYVDLRYTLSIPKLRVHVGEHPAVSVKIVPGPPGPAGPPGEDGPPGADGAPGARGEGPSWWFGSGPPTTVPGAITGDRYFDEDSGDFYLLE